MQKKIKIIPIIISRIDSKRLRGKCFLKIHKKRNVIECIFQQLLRIKKLEKPILAIPNDKKNNQLKKFAIKKNIRYFAGTNQNVFKRIADAANFYKADYILRINGDSPIIDKNLIKEAIKKKNLAKYLYHSNILKRTYPYGISLQIISVNFLNHLKKFKMNKNEKENITPLLHKKKFLKISKSYVLKKNFYWKSKLTIDTIHDYKKLKELFSKINFLKKNFSWKKSKIMKVYLLDG